MVLPDKERQTDDCVALTLSNEVIARESHSLLSLLFVERIVAAKIFSNDSLLIDRQLWHLFIDKKKKTKSLVPYHLKVWLLCINREHLVLLS